MAHPLGDRPAHRRRGAVLRLAPWTRAPLLGVRRVSVLLAVAGAAAIFAIVACSAGLFLSSASSATLHSQIAARCADAAYPAIHAGFTGFPAGVADTGKNFPRVSVLTELDAAVPRAIRAAGLPSPQSFFYVGSALAPARVASNAASDQGLQGFLMYGQRIVSHVHRLTPGLAGSGVWVPDTTARSLHLRPGSTARVDLAPVRVVGVYRDLFADHSDPYWCSRSQLVGGASYEQNLPTNDVLPTDYATFARLAVGFPSGADWLAPIGTRRMTLQRAQQINGEEADAVRRLAAISRDMKRRGIDLSVQDPGGVDQLGGSQQALPDMVDHTRLVRSALVRTVIPIAAGGGLLALLLVGGAGGFWAERRLREVRLLVARGVSPALLGVKAGLELLVPTALGVVVGWAVAIGLVRWIGPSGNLDARAPGDAAAVAGIGLVVALALGAAAAVLRARSLTETRPDRRRIARWAARTPLELPVLGLAVWAGVRVHADPAVTVTRFVATLSPLLVIYPLLLVMGGGLLAARLVYLGYAGLTRWRGRRWRLPAFLAAHRITGAPLIAQGLIVGAVVPVAVLVYATAASGTIRTTADASASVYVGAHTVAVSVDPLRPTPALDRVGTLVTRYQGAMIAGHRAEVLAIDPHTFARTAYWHAGFGGRSLASLVGDLDRPEPRGTVAALLVRRDPSSTTRLILGASSRTVDVVATPSVLPGIRDNYADLLIVDADRLGDLPVGAQLHRHSELWSNGSTSAANAALVAAGARLLFDVSPNDLLATDYAATLWTFDYLRALAVLVGVLAISALALYLSTRQRASTISYILTRRMGLSRSRHLASLLTEIAALLVAAAVIGCGLAWIAALTVYSGLDADPTRLPDALYYIPGATIIVTAAVVVCTIAAGSLATQRVADRAQPAAVLRTDA
ncbi:MAG: FtsX-like permease family protein [Mycobacteriales bacterium]